MDRFALMHAFVRVAETASFTKAAEQLGLSRATVSSSIQQLEERLGARLLHRTTRRVSLTDEGKLFLARARTMLEQLDETESLFRDARPSVAGRLHVDVPTRIARRIIVPALPELLAQHPGLEIHLRASDRATNLVESGVDAVVRVGALRDSSHIVRPLGSLTQINCASAGYLARHGQPRTLADLGNHVLVGYAPGQHAISWEYVAKGVERSLPMRSAVAAYDAETYVAAGLAGLGLIQIPAYDVRHHLESGALIGVMPRFVPAPLPIALVYPSRKQVPRRLDAFVRWVTGLFERHGMLTRSASGPR